jgi:hypothetical protein
MMFLNLQSAVSEKRHLFSAGKEILIALVLALKIDEERVGARVSICARRAREVCEHIFAKRLDSGRWLCRSEHGAPC